MKTTDELEETLISFIVSKYWVIKIMSMTSLVDAPGTLVEKPITLSFEPSFYNSLSLLLASAPWIVKKIGAPKNRCCSKKKTKRVRIGIPCVIVLNGIRVMELWVWIGAGWENWLIGDFILSNRKTQHNKLY